MALAIWLGFRETNKDKAAALGFEIVETYPHDATSFTQGFEFLDGKLIESAGLYGESEIRVTDPETGEVIGSHPVANEFFAEGLTEVNGQLVQLTWKAGTAFVYDLDGDQPTLTEQTYNYGGEGWGLCETDEALIRSDGTKTLTLHDKSTFAELSTLTVTGRDGEIKVNELECSDGFVWANIFQSNEIIKFDASTGEITQTLNLTSLVPDDLTDPNAVLNGLAIHPDTQNLWVTGKLWPTAYELKILAP